MNDFRDGTSEAVHAPHAVITRLQESAQRNNENAPISAKARIAKWQENRAEARAARFRSGAAAARFGSLATAAGHAG
jgi:hypothetical protein